MNRSRLRGLGTAVRTRALPPAAPAAAVTADRVWQGYRIDTGTNAAGKWIGARAYASRPVYRLHPRAKASTGGFGATYTVEDLAGSGPVEVTPRLTSRA